MRAGAGDIGDLALVDGHVLAVVQIKRRLGIAREPDILESDIAQPRRLDNRLRVVHEHDFGGFIIRGIPVEHALFTIDIPLAGNVEFLEEVEEVVAALDRMRRRFGPDAEIVDALGGYRMRLAVDLLDAQHIARPVVVPVAEHPDALRDVPAAGTRIVGRIAERTAADGAHFAKRLVFGDAAVDDILETERKPPLVRVPRQRLRLAVDDELDGIP